MKRSGKCGDSVTGALKHRPIEIQDIEGVVEQSSDVVVHA
jgi:hypothetical protein